ncbi:HD domain-containing protein [Saccharopolyspora sp. NPDC050389]|uniref:HD domain-containing protein n=1 Tax=Saccharopolyspora sp. NPDC050389 TaxID=3155516 RepID=UPI003407C4DD
MVGPYPPTVTTVGRAYELAEALLRESLPRRWEHTRGVATCARRLAPLVGDLGEVLETAAVLHDIGYAQSLVDTGFHPLDGARYLRAVNAASPSSSTAASAPPPTT